MLLWKFTTLSQLVPFLILGHCLSISELIFLHTAEAFPAAFSSAFRSNHHYRRLHVTYSTGTDMHIAAVTQDPTTTATERAKDRSTLILLEHINLNVPNHDHILPFYLDLLGCGLDPRKATNLNPNAAKKTIWANCGASQFHLPYGDVAQIIPGTIGLRFRNWKAFAKRLTDMDEAHVQMIENGVDQEGCEFLRIRDHYGNTFLCRPDESHRKEKEKTNNNIYQWKQPIITSTAFQEWGHIAEKYGRTESDCSVIDFVEFLVPIGMATKIALFYDSVFDATTSVVQIDSKSTAVIAFGNVDTNGRPDQSLVFRESSLKSPPYDGHHIAMYVGETAEDFEQAFKNAATAGIVWVNPRFSDKADTLQGARDWKQFRFKNIVDMTTGETIFELEHEMRSCEHEAWPGKTTA